jgi:Z1 domain
MIIADIDWLVERIGESVRGGRTPDQAYKDYCRMFPPDQVKAALVKFEEITGRIRTLKEPTTLQQRGLLNWYPGPSPKDRYWPPLYRSLLQRGGWDLEAIKSLDEASTKIVSLLQPPGLGQINTRGLVIGYVQSGKTANYSAVISKAADVGYKFFIVLSGLTNPLRFQTQERLERELVDLNRGNWVALTGLDRDFFPTGAVGNVDAFLTEHHDYKVLCVVKKNATVLRRLLRWLRAARKEVLSNCPVLLIDDEADQASVNASKFKDKRTAINQRILDILTVLPKAAYVGYTATPFANVFIDPQPEDIYPRDFIVNLPKPKDYFGTEQIFGREPLSLDDPEQIFDGLDMIRLVEDDEIPALTPQGRNGIDTFVPEITPSLEKALRYFWMATAARIARGGLEQDSTMLIHTSLRIEAHALFQAPVQDYRDELLASLESKQSTLIEELRTQWDEEQSRVPPEEMDEKGTSFDELIPYLKDAVSRTDVVVENSRSVQRLVYGDQAKIQIVIGGNTLARGLTLKGLVVSFFVRATNAYDTLLQMGRWFGYRRGYADLPRIWMTEELAGFFSDLATVEQEIRNDIRRYEAEGITPIDFGVRVRTHPDLSITSRLKMQATIDCDVSYRDTHPQTIFFKHKDREWLTNNINAAKSLICQICIDGIKGELAKGRYIIFRDVPVEFIFKFLREYKFHEDSIVLQERLIREYIEAQNEDGELTIWNVVIVGGRRTDQVAGIDLGLREPIPLLNRTKYIIGPPKDYANLKAIVSPPDRTVDINIEKEVQAEKEAASAAVRPAGSPGLLLIYPIAKDSAVIRKETQKGGLREPLDAVEHIIGVSLVFPDSTNPTPQRYKTVDLSRLVREEPEWPEEEDENS